MNRLLLLFSLLLPVVNFGRTLLVGPDQALTSIAVAIQRAEACDTLLILEGNYPERGLLIDKSLTLLARGAVTIDAQGEATDLLLIAADYVTVEGFTLANVGVSFLREAAAVRVRNSRYFTIADNEIVDCFFGVYLEYASHGTVRNNRILGSFVDEASAGNAIHAWKGHHLTIEDNTAHGHRDGIYFEFIDDSSIRRNYSYGNLRYGLHFMFSNRDAYHRNHFQDNGAGVAVMFSHQIAMIDNDFIHNWGGAAYGLLLKEISDGEITGNRFTQNTTGITAEGANRLDILRNRFTSNGTAIDIKGNCLDNRIEANDFLANTFEVVTNSRYNNNSYRANYWSGYRGYDLDRDGWGDVPYRPVNLFAKITHEIPAATLLLHSSFVNLLEAGEKIFPQLIPEELIDIAPKMQPYDYP
jgi:nitrous oxidase accessory protein